MAQIINISSSDEDDDESRNNTSSAPRQPSFFRDPFSFSESHQSASFRQITCGAVPPPASTSAAVGAAACEVAERVAEAATTQQPARVQSRASEESRAGVEPTSN